MDSANKSRRTVIAGGASAAAGLVAWMTLGGGAASVLGEDGIRVVSGVPPGWPRATASFEGERTAIEALVGETVQLRGPGGAAAAVTERVEAFAIAHAPAGVRATGFVVHFMADRVTAPALDGTVALARPILDLDVLFVTRGSDREGRASLTAVIA